MLMGDASLYYDTFVKKRRDELLKQRDHDRQIIRGGLVNFEDAEARTGNHGMFKPDCDFMAGLARAHVDGMIGAYELEGKPITEHVIDNEIMPNVKKTLSESMAGVLSREQGRMQTTNLRTGGLKPSTRERMKGLVLHLQRFVDETERSIRNDVVLKMLGNKKIAGADAEQSGTMSSATALDPPGGYDYHPEIKSVSEKLWRQGHFRQAVLDSFIKVIETVKERSGLQYEGDDLMNRAFSPDKRIPPVQFNELRNIAQRDEQRGILYLFKGVVQMRNHKAHVVETFDDPHRAHEYLALASLLLRLLDKATIVKPS